MAGIAWFITRFFVHSPSVPVWVAGAVFVVCLSVGLILGRAHP